MEVSLRDANLTTRVSCATPNFASGAFAVAGHRLCAATTRLRRAACRATTIRSRPIRSAPIRAGPLRRPTRRAPFRSTSIIRERTTTTHARAVAARPSSRSAKPGSGVGAPADAVVGAPGSAGLGAAEGARMADQKSGAHVAQRGARSEMARRGRSIESSSVAAQSPGGDRGAAVSVLSVHAAWQHAVHRLASGTD